MVDHGDAGSSVSNLRALLFADTENESMLNLNRDGVLKFTGAVLTAISCIPMLAMLPGGIVTALALIGITTTSAPIIALATPLAPIAQPLLFMSIGILAVGHLRCGRSPTLLAAMGGLLVYLAMYVFVSPVSTRDHSAMEAMPGMPSATAIAGPEESMTGMTGDTASATPIAQMPGLTNEPLFYTGLVLLLGSFVVSGWRQRRKACQPFHPFQTLRAALIRRA